MSIAENYKSVRENLPEDIALVAVSKTHPAEEILEVYQCGQRDFGENKVQELLEKQPKLPQDIRWHLIGHLQSNKVKYIAPFIHTIQSADSEKILAEIDREAGRHGRVIRCYLQIKIATEDSKYGLDFGEAESIIEKYLNSAFPNLKITGLMGMATFTQDESQLREEFGKLRDFFLRMKERLPLDTLSMGMSGDYRVALACGSNSVRIGTAIFGERDYTD